MVSPSEVKDAELLAVAEMVAPKVSRPILQEALIESRLIARTTDREEIRRLARNHGTWTAVIKSGLESPEKRAAALRALRLLVNSYLKLSATDHLIENSFRRAHLAAERGDAQRLQREVERLAEFGRNLAIPELKNPIVLLYLGAASEHARDRIIGLHSDYLADGELAALAPPSETQSPTSDQARTVPPPAEAAEESLVTDLRLLAQAPPAKDALQWNIHELLTQEPLPPSCVPWPTTAPVTADLTNLRHAAAILASAEIPDNGIRIDQVLALRNALQDAFSILAQAPRALEELTNLEETVKTTATAHTEALDATAKIDAQRTLALLNGDAASWAAAITTLDEITGTHYKARESQRAAILDITRSIATLTAELPEERQTIAETKVRFLARRQRLEELRKIHDEIIEEVVKVRAQRAKTQEAATRALAGITPIADQVPNKIKDVLLTAVRNGDIARLNQAIEQAQQHVTAQAKVALTPDTQPPLEPRPSPVATPLTISEPVATGVTEAPVSPLTRTVSFEIRQFTPRDRITQRSQLPKDATGLLNFLLQRALQEMRRGSMLGVIDHALDIILVAAANPQEGRTWSEVGLTLLAALPAAIPAFQEWGDDLADELATDLHIPDAALFRKHIAILVARPGFADAVAERFTQKELEPLIPTIAQTLYVAVCRQSPYLLQDLARGIADSVRYGDITTAKKLLVSIGLAHGLEADVLQHLQAALDAVAYDARMMTALKPLIPSWLLDGAQVCRTAIAEQRSGRVQRAPTRGTFNVQAPQSVQTSGGFVFTPGTDILEVAVQVGNPQELRCVAAELVVPSQRNAWLARDAISYLGPLPPKVRLLAPLRLHLTKELIENQRLEIQVEVRHKEHGSGPTRFQDDNFSAGFQKLGIVTIQDYDGASGKPIILQGDALRLSSESVKNALTEILHNLRRGMLAALILGRRRRGKTSILTTIAHDAEIRKNYVILQDSVEDLPFRTLSEALGHLGNILDRAGRYLDLQVDPIEPVLRAQPHLGWSVLQEWLTTITGRLPEHKRILLLLDEFQKWISLLDAEGRTKVLAVFRGLMNRPHGETLSIAIVLSGLTNIREYTKTSADFLNAFRIYEVKSFNTAEAAALIRSNTSIEFDARAVARIGELSGGNPFLINLLGNDIAARLREHGRPYCFPDDVERVVKSQLDDRQNSRVWNFLQYLLKQGEEDHASEIVELPGLIALAWTLKTRGSRRAVVAVEEIVEELRKLDVECDPASLTTQLEAAAQNELVTKQGDRYAFSSGWLGEWLAVVVNEQPIAVKKAKDQDLILNRYRIVELLDRGGQGTIYLGQDTLTFHSPVILKVYARTQGDNLLSISEREAKALCAIQHNAIVRCYSYGTDPKWAMY